MKHPKLFTACIAVLSMSLGACGIHLESSATHLPALTGFALSRDASARTEAAASTASWDCIAQTLPKSAVHTADFYEAETIENALLDRASRSLERGSKDSRQLRCSLTNTSPSDLAQASLRADVNLLQSDSQDVRLFGVQAALDDLRLWAGAPTVTFPAVVTLQ